MIAAARTDFCSAVGGEIGSIRGRQAGDIRVLVFAYTVMPDFPVCISQTAMVMRLDYPNHRVSSCAGFSDACMTEPSARATGGVREAPRHEIAEYGARRLGAAYGDSAAAWRVG